MWFALKPCLIIKIWYFMNGCIISVEGFATHCILFSVWNMGMQVRIEMIYLCVLMMRYINERWGYTVQHPTLPFHYRWQSIQLWRGKNLWLKLHMWIQMSLIHLFVLSRQQWVMFPWLDSINHYTMDILFQQERANEIWRPMFFLFQCHFMWCPWKSKTSPFTLPVILYTTFHEGVFPLINKQQ